MYQNGLIGTIIQAAHLRAVTFLSHNVARLH